VLIRSNQFYKTFDSGKNLTFLCDALSAYTMYNDTVYEYILVNFSLNVWVSFCDLFSATKD